MKRHCCGPPSTPSGNPENLLPWGCAQIPAGSGLIASQLLPGCFPYNKHEAPCIIPPTEKEPLRPSALPFQRTKLSPEFPGHEKLLFVIRTSSDKLVKSRPSERAGKSSQWPPGLLTQPLIYGTSPVPGVCWASSRS